MVGDENDSQTRLDFDSSVNGSASTVIESHSELGEPDKNTRQSLQALDLHYPKASFDADYALRSVLETYFDEADGPGKTRSNL